MYDTILVPTDGSDHAVRAAEHGLALARAFDATVHVINVVDIQRAAGVFDVGGVDRKYIEQLETQGRNAVGKVEAIASETDMIRTAVLEGDPSEAILAYADKHDVELLAMGTRGRTGVKRYLLGSVTERVVRQADVPVLTVRAAEGSQATPEYDEILIPTDGSKPAAAAVDHGLAIAENTGGRVHAVYVSDARTVSATPDGTEISDLIEQLESKGENATEDIATQAESVGVDAVTEIRTGSPARELLEYADQNDIDLIAMGTTGRTGIDRHLLGSTTERTIRHADVPVLAVNARNRED